MICDHSSIHQYVKKITHWNLWMLMDIRVITSDTFGIIMRVIMVQICPIWIKMLLLIK